MCSVVRRSSSASGEGGAVAVEFALVLPLLVMLLMGTITGGIAYSNGIGLANAVREGARFGASAAPTATWATDVANRTRQLQFDDPAAESAVCAQLVRAPNTVIRTDCVGSATVEARIAGSPPVLAAEPRGCLVRVWAGRPFTVDTGVAAVWDDVMVRSSVARYEGPTC